MVWRKRSGPLAQPGVFIPAAPAAPGPQRLSGYTIRGDANPMFLPDDREVKVSIRVSIAVAVQPSLSSEVMGPPVPRLLILLRPEGL